MASDDEAMCGILFDTRYEAEKALKKIVSIGKKQGAAEMSKKNIDMAASVSSGEHFTIPGYTSTYVNKVTGGLKFTVAMITFNPLTGEEVRPEYMNESDKTTYDACKGAMEILNSLKRPTNDRIQSCIDHIKTSVDVDPWAVEIAEKALEFYAMFGGKQADDNARVMTLAEVVEEGKKGEFPCWIEVLCKTEDDGNKQFMLVPAVVSADDEYIEWSGNSSIEGSIFHKDYGKTVVVWKGKPEEGHCYFRKERNGNV